MSAAPDRLASALDRIADALVSLTLEREAREQAVDTVAPAPETVATPVTPPVDRVLLARVGERLDSAIAMLRDVLAEPEAVAEAEHPAEAEEIPAEHDHGSEHHEPEHHHGGDGG